MEKKSVEKPVSSPIYQLGNDPTTPIKQSSSIGGYFSPPRSPSPSKSNLALHKENLTSKSTAFPPTPEPTPLKPEDRRQWLDSASTPSPATANTKRQENTSDFTNETAKWLVKVETQNRLFREQLQKIQASLKRDVFRGSTAIIKAEHVNLDEVLETIDKSTPTTTEQIPEIDKWLLEVETQNRLFQDHMHRVFETWKRERLRASSQDNCSDSIQQRHIRSTLDVSTSPNVEHTPDTTDWLLEVETQNRLFRDLMQDIFQSWKEDRIQKLRASSLADRPMKDKTSLATFNHARPTPHTPTPLVRVKCSILLFQKRLHTLLQSWDEDRLRSVVATVEVPRNGVSGSAPALERINATPKRAAEVAQRSEGAENQIQLFLARLQVLFQSWEETQLRASTPAASDEIDQKAEDKASHEPATSLATKSKHASEPPGKTQIGQSSTPPSPTQKSTSTLFLTVKEESRDCDGKSVQSAFFKEETTHSGSTHRRQLTATKVPDSPPTSAPVKVEGFGRSRTPSPRRSSPPAPADEETLAEWRHKLDLVHPEWGSPTRPYYMCGSYIERERRGCWRRAASDRDLINAKLHDVIPLDQSSPDIEDKLLELIELVHCRGPTGHNRSYLNDARIARLKKQFSSGDGINRIPRETRIKQIFGGLSVKCVTCGTEIGGRKVLNIQNTITEILQPHNLSNGIYILVLLQVVRFNMLCNYHAIPKHYEDVDLWRTGIYTILTEVGNAEKVKLTIATDWLETSSVSANANIAAVRKAMASSTRIEDMCLHFDGNPATFWRNGYDSSPFRLLPGVATSNPMRTYAAVQAELGRKFVEADGDMRSGFVYAYENEANPGLLKIGYTSNTVQGRIDAWAFDCNRKARILYPPQSRASASVRVNYARRIEQLCHAELREHNKTVDCRACLKRHVEWFEVSAAVAIATIEKWTRWMATEPYVVRTRFGLPTRTQEEMTRHEDIDRFMSEISAAAG